MKQLYLIRHAKAIHDNSFKDFDRTLNARGVDDAHLMGLVLRQLKIQPQAIISSPAQRAISTAIIFCNELGFPPNAIIKKERLYEAGMQDYIKTLQEADDNSDTLFLFAHNPTITEVCNLLAERTFIDNLPTTGIIGFSLNIQSWKELKAGKGLVTLVDYPKARRTS